MKILVTPTSLQPASNAKALDTLRTYSNDLVFNEAGRPLTEAELIPLLKDCDGYIAGLDYITDKVIDACPRLKVISRYGAGYDRVNISAAQKNGVVVTNTPGVNAEAVGELAFSLILSVARQIPALHNLVLAGKWPRSTGMELKGKTIGIMGLGAIGKVVARCAQGFGMNVIAYDPFINEIYCSCNSIRSESFHDVLKECDVLSLHLPLSESTKHIIDANAIAQMKPTAIIVNTSRGGIVDETAAYHALMEHRLAGLGLDAFEEEPPQNSPLFQLDNVVVTPHTGAHTSEATLNMANAAVENLITVLSGQECPYTVTN